MAYLEKVCEFSGDYPSTQMYAWKRNSIQVCPKFREKFRGAIAYLEIQHVSFALVDKKGRSTSFYQSDLIDFWEVRCPGKESYLKDATPEEYFDYHKSRGYRLKREYYYRLVVLDSNLQGEVGGVYSNWSKDISTVKRKLQRITRQRLEVRWLCPKPKVTRIIRDWINEKG